MPSSSSDRRADEPRGRGGLAGILKSWATLSVGNMGASALSLAAIIVAARSLGPHDYGLLVTVQALGLFIASLFDCCTDVALMKFGTEALERGDRPGLQRLIKLLLMIDAAGACLALLAAWAVLALAAGLFKIGPDMVMPAGAYCLLLLTGMKGVPAGLLRIFDRYALIPVRDVLGALLRLLFAVVLAGLGQASLTHFLVLWFIAEVVGNVTFFAIGLRELRKHNYSGTLSTPLNVRRELGSEVGRALLFTTGSSIIRVGSERVDTLFVSAVLGPVAVSVFNVAKNFANILIRLCDTVQHAVAPQFARLWARDEIHAFRRMSIHIALVACLATAAILAVLSLGAPSIIRLLFGAAYVESAPVLIALTAAFAVILLGNLYMAALVSMGRAGAVMWVSCLSAAALFVPLPFLLSGFGIMGVSMGHGLRALVWAGGLFTICSLLVRRRLARRPGDLANAQA